MICTPRLPGEKSPSGSACTRPASRSPTRPTAPLRRSDRPHHFDRAAHVGPGLGDAVHVLRFEPPTPDRGSERGCGCLPRKRRSLAERRVGVDVVQDRFESTHRHGPDPGRGPGGFDPGPGTPPGGFGPDPGPGPGGFDPGPGGGGGGPGPSDPGGLTPNIGGPLTPGPGYWNPFPGPYPGDPGATGVLVPHPLGGTNGPGIGIVDIIVEEPGTGYLSGPDGSHGGDGRTYADKCDVRVTRVDGRKELPYPVGTTVCVNEGDTVILPPGTSVITEPFDSVGGGENILGGSPHVMINAGCFTVTECPDAPKSESTYPVLLYLCDVIIRSPGSGYKSTDTISINPDLGAKAQLVVDKFGRITDVVVTEGGQGYQVMPTITIITSTGRNAVLLPKLCIDRVDDDEILDQEKVISVVDCVGKF